MSYGGVLHDFVQGISRFSDGDFKVEYSHGSRVSAILHPDSTGTASVQDVADGLVDLVVAPLWITAQRLKMAGFTVPIGKGQGNVACM